MFNLSGEAFIAAILISALLLYGFAWWATRGAPLVVRAATRILLGALIVVPIALVVLQSGGELAEAPSSSPPVAASRDESAAAPEPAGEAAAPADEEMEARPASRPLKKKAAKPAEPASDDSEPAAPAEEVAVSEEAAGSAPPAAAPPAGTPGDGAAERDVAIAMEDAPGGPAATPMARPDGAAQPRAYRRPTPADEGTAAAPSTAPPANGPSVDTVDQPWAYRVPTQPPADAAGLEAAAPAESEDYSVVPVFYGTDRARADQPERIGYDWQRGLRLEIGQALVTIPKNHEVPKVERPWAIRIPVLDITLVEGTEDPKKHFTIKELKALSEEEFLDLVRKRLARSSKFKDHALVFVHGYRTRFDNAVYRTAQIAYDLDFDGAPFLYSWPSGGTLQGYTYDRESAGQAEPHLRRFLELVINKTGAKKVSIIAHSMGNQPTLRVLQDLKRSLPEGVVLSQLILAAPDVDRDNFAYIVSSIRGIAEGITLYAAANDQALLVSRRVNGGIARAGDVPDGGPIVVEGVDTIDATATSMDSVGINHSGYAENNALLKDIARLIATGVRPPSARLPDLEQVMTASGQPYWRYPESYAKPRARPEP